MDVDLDKFDLTNRLDASKKKKYYWLSCMRTLQCKKEKGAGLITFKVKTCPFFIVLLKYVTV